MTKAVMVCQAKGCRDTNLIWKLIPADRPDIYSMLQKRIGFCTSTCMQNWIQEYNSGQLDRIIPKIRKATKKEKKQ